MAAETFFDYYGDESTQFSFYRIPQQLITGKCFKHISVEAKLLYGLLLDRMGLSAKSGWHDKSGRVYIYYTLAEIQENLNCGHDKAIKLFVRPFKRQSRLPIFGSLDCGKPAAQSADFPQQSILIEPYLLIYINQSYALQSRVLQRWTAAPKVPLSQQVRNFDSKIPLVRGNP